MNQCTPTCVKTRNLRVFLPVWGFFFSTKPVKRTLMGEKEGKEVKEGPPA